LKKSSRVRGSTKEGVHIPVTSEGKQKKRGKNDDDQKIRKRQRLTPRKLVGARPSRKKFGGETRVVMKDRNYRNERRRPLK